MVLVKSRSKPTYQTSNLYGGVVTWTKCDPIDYAMYLLEEMALWLFQFRDNDTDFIYLGYMDIDLEVEPNAQIADEIVEEIEERFPSIPYHLYFSGKKGFHVYLQHPELFIKLYKDNNNKLSDWISKDLVTKIFGKKLAKRADPSVYHINKGIRPYYCRHPKTDVQPKVVRKYVPPGKEEKNFLTWLLETLPTVQLKIHPYTQPRTPLTRATEHQTELNNTSTVETDGTILGHLAQVYGCELKHINGELFIPDGKGYCLISDRNHAKVKNYVIVKKNHATVKCFSSNCNHKRVVIKKSVDSLTRVDTLITELYEKNNILTKPRYIRDDTSKEKYLSNDCIHKLIGSDTGINIGCLFSPMGSGKTHQLVNWIKEQNDIKILILVTRQTQGTNFAAIYPECVNYMNVSQCFTQKRLVICLNSLIRILGPNSEFPSYDLLVLDEIESIIEAITGSFLSLAKTGSQITIWDLFISLIKTVPRVIMMDGIPTARTFAFLDRIKVLGETRIIQHLYKPDYRTYAFYESPDPRMFDIMKNDLAIGKNVVFISTSKSFIKYIDEVVCVDIDPNLKMTILGDSHKDTKATSIDPNNFWSKKLLMYNSAVGAGASFDAHHFDSIFVVVTCSNGTPQNLMQLIHRIRNVLSKKIHICIMPNKKVNNTFDFQKNKENKLNQIIGFHSTQLKRTLVLQNAQSENTKFNINTASLTLVKELSTQGMFMFKPEDDEFLNTACNEETYKLSLMNHEKYTEVLYDMIMRNGGIITDIKKSKISPFKVMKKVRSHNKKSTTTKNVLWSKPEWMSEDQNKKCNQMLQLNQLDKYFNWIMLKNAILKDKNNLYTEEFKKIHLGKKALTNTILYSSIVLPRFTLLSNLCGFTIDNTTAIFKGTILYNTLADPEIKTVLSLLSMELNNKVKNNLINHHINESTPGYYKKTIAELMIKIFDVFGIPLIKKRGRRVSHQGITTNTNSITFDVKTQQLRLAAQNLNPETGMTDPDALKTFVESNF